MAILISLTCAVEASSVQAGEIKVSIDSAGGTATIDVQRLEGFALQIAVKPNEERESLVVRVELPESGPQSWPVERVQVFDQEGEALAVTRGGIEWHRLKFGVPSLDSRYYVRADPVDKPVKWPRESEHVVTDPTTGLSATVCRWFGNKRAALSLRFDDSHPTHLTTVIPVLDRYGFRGTFMINPGRSEFQSHKTEWEAVAASGRHEFANHTMHHRGATSDLKLEQEIGDASEYIWRLFPDRSRLVALNIGGGTTITTTKPLQYFLDKYDVFPVWGSLGMDDVYGNRAAAFRRHLERHIERGLWCRTHFHSVGTGLATSTENLIAAMEIVKHFESEVWVTGLADAFKYQHARNTTKLTMETLSPEETSIQLTCLSNPELYDHPLTLDIGLPETWNAFEVSVTDGSGSPVRFIRRPSTSGALMVRFNVAPITGRYLIRRESPAEAR